MKELKITATTEQEFRDQFYEIAKSVNTKEELYQFIDFANNYPVGYAGVVYVHSAAMIATQRILNLGPGGGITGFQAGRIGWEMVEKFMMVGDCGLSIIDWQKMLYPQYKEKFEKTISREIFEGLQKKAKEILDKANNDESINGNSLHPAVRKHMESIVKGVVPFGYIIKG